MNKISCSLKRILQFWLRWPRWPYWFNAWPLKDSWVQALRRRPATRSPMTGAASTCPTQTHACTHRAQSKQNRWKQQGKEGGNEETKEQTNTEVGWECRGGIAETGREAWTGKPPLALSTVPRGSANMTYNPQWECENSELWLTATCMRSLLRGIDPSVLVATQ